MTSLGQSHNLQPKNLPFDNSPVQKPLPHWAIIVLGAAELPNALTYLPCQDGSSNCNIGLHAPEFSLENLT
jgi:hypothetical protein